jgi:hypothetical protein
LESSVEERFKASIVCLILNGKTEQALALLAKHYCCISTPKIEVGLPRGRKKRALGCYTPKDKTIAILNSDVLKEPFIVLHEFYHHLRTTADAKHKGNEKYADNFAKGFIEAYKRLAPKDIGSH